MEQAFGHFTSYCNPEQCDKVVQNRRGDCTPSRGLVFIPCLRVQSFTYEHNEHILIVAFNFEGLVFEQSLA
jgi:hypothetical protein